METLKKIENSIKRSNTLKEYFREKSLNKDYDFFLQNCRSLVLDKLKIEDFNSDTIIFVEEYSRESSGYSCSVFKTNIPNNLSFYIRRKYPPELEYLKEGDLFSEYTIEEIRKGNIAEIIKKGNKSRLYQVVYLYITIARRRDDQYIIRSYSTKSFIR